MKVHFKTFKRMVKFEPRWASSGRELLRQGTATEKALSPGSHQPF